MGQDFYVCDECGEAFGDHWDGYEMCECGKSYCCQECADKHSFKRYDKNDDDFNEDEVPTDKNGYMLDSACDYCRGENFTDLEMLEYALDKWLNMSRTDLVLEYISHNKLKEK